MKKKTFEEVEAAFNQRDFTLVSKDYKSAHSILEYTCFQGHKCKISYANLQQGNGCSECSGKKKKTIEEVREVFSSRGFTLLSSEYNGNKSRLDYICSNNHQAKIKFNDLQQGYGCPECSGNKKKTFDEVKEQFSTHGYQLLSTEYNGALSPLNYLCSNGHQSRINFNNLMNGKGCSSCAEHGFNPNKPATLYYLRFQFTGNFYYKIGITNRTILERFQKEKTSYTVINETFYKLGKDAYAQEQAILEKFSASRYKGKPFLTDGNTELFIKDILQLDDSILKAGRM